MAAASLADPRLKLLVLGLGLSKKSLVTQFIENRFLELWDYCAIP